MQTFEQIDGEILKLLRGFTHRRITRAIGYFILFTGAVASIVAPSEVFLEQSSSGLSMAWSLMFTGAALLCFLGNVLDRWVFEYVMIPLLSTTLIVFSIALFSSAYTTDKALIIPYACFFGAYAFGLLGRWRDVQCLMRVNIPVRSK